MLGCNYSRVLQNIHNVYERKTFLSSKSDYMMTSTGLCTNKSLRYKEGNI